MIEKTISETKHRQLEKKMADLHINEKDLKETYTLGSGKGGQKVNKSATCVKLIYEKLNINITCQKSRSRALNRYHARKLLCEKVEQLLLGKQSSHTKKIEKLKKQKARRKRRSTSKIENKNTT
tara:strand:+ start:108 stop:479 length:372 start_codon:yes stop_codon:yes gene_type:complete